MVQRQQEVGTDRTTLPETGFSGGLIKGRVISAIDGIIQAATGAHRSLDRLLDDLRVTAHSEPPPAPPPRPNGRYRGRLQSSA